MNLNKQIKSVGTVGLLSLMSSVGLHAATLTFDGGDTTIDVADFTATNQVTLNLVANGLDASTVSMGIGVRFNSDVVSFSSSGAVDPFWNFGVNQSNTLDTYEIYGNYLDLSFGTNPDFADIVSQDLVSLTFDLVGVGSANLEFYWLALDGKGEWGYVPEIVIANTLQTAGYCVTIDDVNCLNPPALSDPSNLHLLLDPTSLTVTSAAVVPVPAAAWLFGSGLIGLIAVSRRKA